jgi:hypothetical protein
MGVEFEVGRWSPADASVDLSFACIFEHEMPGSSLSGGLLHLDQALSGLLTELRAQGAFRATAFETLFIAAPSEAVKARQVMLIGLGDPTKLRLADLERAASLAASEAVRLKANSVAFAPSLLDSGHRDNGNWDVPAALLRGALSGLRTENLLAERGVSGAPSLKRWSFDVGAARFEHAVAQFQAAFPPGESPRA